MQPATSYDCVMTQPCDAEGLPSPSSALLQLARLKADMSQRELAERAGVPVTMISAYERDLRQPTLNTLLKLLHAAGFDLRLHLAAYDVHDDILAELEAGRSDAERLRRDRQLQAWRQATSAEDVA
jgi:transcriptional regulator with XRE-family HTH domain